MTLPLTSDIADRLLPALVNLLEDDNGDDDDEGQEDDARDDDVEIGVVPHVRRASLLPHYELPRRQDVGRPHLIHGIHRHAVLPSREAEEEGGAGKVHAVSLMVVLVRAAKEGDVVKEWEAIPVGVVEGGPLETHKVDGGGSGGQVVVEYLNLRNISTGSYIHTETRKRRG